MSGGHEELSPLAPANGLVTDLLTGAQASLQLLPFLEECEKGTMTFIPANILSSTWIFSVHEGIDYRNHFTAYE